MRLHRSTVQGLRTAMLIGLDACHVHAVHRRGTGRNLVDLYTKLARVRPGWRVLAYHRDLDAQEDLLPPVCVRPARVEMAGDRLDAWLRWRLPPVAWRDRAAVLHCLANTCPSWMPVPTVVTIHDLIPLDLPAGRPALQVRRFEQSIKAACRQEAHIICPSRYTRDRLVGEFDADPYRTTVNYRAAGRSMKQATRNAEHRKQAIEAVLSRFGVRKPFVLHFGAPAPRKNTRRVIESWSKIEALHRTEWSLLIVGLNDETRQSLSKVVAGLDVASSVKLCPFADETDLPALLEAADVLAYPSRGEGFGLPVLDAWSAGTAVLTSNTTSLPEVAADAALMAGVCALVERHRPRAVTGLGQHSTLMLRGLARRRALRIWYAGDDEDVLWKRSPLPSRMRACPRTCEVGGQGSPSSIRRPHPAPRLRSGSPLRSPIDT